MTTLLRIAVLLALALRLAAQDAAPSREVVEDLLRGGLLTEEEADAFERFGDAALPALREIAAAPPEHVVHDALGRAIDAVYTPGAHELMLAILRGETGVRDDVAERPLWTMAQIGSSWLAQSDAARAAILARLDDARPPARTWAAGMCGLLGYEEAVPRLRVLAGDDDDTLGHVARVALEQLRSPPVGTVEHEFPIVLDMELVTGRSAVALPAVLPIALDTRGATPRLALVEDGRLRFLDAHARPTGEPEALPPGTLDVLWFEEGGPRFLAVSEPAEQQSVVTLVGAGGESSWSHPVPSIWWLTKATTLYGADGSRGLLVRGMKTIDAFDEALTALWSLQEPGIPGIATHPGAPGLVAHAHVKLEFLTVEGRSLHREWAEWDAGGERSSMSCADILLSRGGEEPRLLCTGYSDTSASRLAGFDARLQPLWSARLARHPSGLVRIGSLEAATLCATVVGERNELLLFTDDGALLQTVPLGEDGAPWRLLSGRMDGVPVVVVHLRTRLVVLRLDPALVGPV